jgi:sulfhydrogenase subunit alpha
MSDSKSKAEAGSAARTLRVPALARVEGEGGLHITMVDQVRLDIYEPPRFYEAFLRGRDFREVPDITARICGICPVAYQMGACHALEKCMGEFNRIDPPLRTLRNLLYCGEWIESHVLHIFMLHLPDFLGYESVISMAADHGPTVKRALRLKKLGNALVTALAGRAVHPVGVCVGGFYKALDPAAAKELLPEVKACLDDMCELTLFLAQNLKYPDLERDYEFVALQPDDEYPMNLGPIASNKGFRVEQDDYLDVMEERHVQHSNALHAIIKGRGAYMVGPLARLNLNWQKLHPRAAGLLPQVCSALRHQLPWTTTRSRRVPSCPSSRAPASAATAPRPPAASAGTSTAPTPTVPSPRPASSRPPARTNSPSSRTCASWRRDSATWTTNRPSSAANT